MLQVGVHQRSCTADPPCATDSVFQAVQMSPCVQPGIVTVRPDKLQSVITRQCNIVQLDVLRYAVAIQYPPPREFINAHSTAAALPQPPKWKPGHLIFCPHDFQNRVITMNSNVPGGLHAERFSVQTLNDSCNKSTYSVSVSVMPTNSTV